jgi:hypothetical protein
LISDESPYPIAMNSIFAITYESALIASTADSGYVHPPSDIKQSTYLSN